METNTMWQLCKKNDFKGLVTAILNDEALYLQISALLLHQNKFRYPKKETRLLAFLKDSKNQITAIALCSASGELYQCYKKQISLEAFSELLQLQIKSYGIITTLVCRPTLPKDLYSFFYNYLKEKGLTFYRQKYYFMSAPSSNFPRREDYPNWFTISYNHKKNLQELYSLHGAYLQEEVYLHKRLSFNQAISISPLLLKDQLVAGAYYQNRLVAKVNTNLKGLNIVQLGGIYTKAEARKRGIATHLLNAISSRLSSYYPQVALFVRQENSKAINLYQKVGFCIIGDLEIYYIEKSY